MLTWKNYFQLLDEMEMGTLPRRYGSPHSVIIASRSGVERWFEQHWEAADAPMFVSHNAYAQAPPGHKIDVNRFLFRTAFGDADTGDGTGMKPEEVHPEVQRLSQWLVDQKVPHVWKASGSPGGFHVRPIFKQEERSKAYLDKWENALWRGAKHALNLRCINIRCADPQRMERLPFTPYVHKKDPTVTGYKREDAWCVPVPYQWIAEGRFDEIEDLTKHPRLFESYRAPGEEMTLEQFGRKQGWETFGHEVNALHPMGGPLPQGSVVDLNQLYIPRKMCLQTLPFGLNPRHSVRVAWAVEVCNLGLSLDEAIDMCMKVGQAAKWEDYDPDSIREQMTQIWRKVNQPDGYRPWSCPTLRENGVCVGPSCSLFKKAFPIEWGEYLKAHPEIIE